MNVNELVRVIQQNPLSALVVADRTAKELYGVTRYNVNTTKLLEILAVLSPRGADHIRLAESLVEARMLKAGMPS